MASEQLSKIFLPNNLRKKLRDHAHILGLKTSLLNIYKTILFLSCIFALGLSVYLFFTGYMEFYRLFNRILISLSLVTILFFLFYVIFWVLFFAYVNLRVYYRTKLIESYLSDYLGFTAANLRAGMPIDKALWLAIRPRFGPLAEEMEIVAKSTMSGADLTEALSKFGNKYDSKLLKRAVSLLNEGLNAGGRISDLISKIAWNLDEVEIMKKEISADVTNYVIFIGFATIIAAPVLFALCSMLLNIISGLQDIVGPASTVASSQALPVSFLKSGISKADFNIYASLSLGVTSMFSSMIISIIRKGNVKDGLKYIPLFLGASLLLYMVASKILQFLFSGII